MFLSKIKDCNVETYLLLHVCSCEMISQDFYNLNIFPYNQTIVVLRRFITMFILEAYKAFD